MTTNYHFELSLAADQIRGCVVCVCVWSHIPPWSPGIGTNCWLIGREWIIGQTLLWSNRKVPAEGGYRWRWTERSEEVFRVSQGAAMGSQGVSGPGGQGAGGPGSQGDGQFQFQNRIAKRTNLDRLESSEVWWRWLNIAHNMQSVWLPITATKYNCQDFVW